MALSPFLQFTARANPCSRHLWGTLARAVASICAHRARPKKLIVWLQGIYIFEVCAVICRNDHCYASRAQKPHFRVKTTKNLEKIAHSDTKPRFCARKAGKWGSLSQKAHKNADFVLGVARNEYREARRGREQPPET